MANKKFRQFAVVLETYPTKIPKRSKPHSSPDSKNSTGDTDLSPISKIKGRGDLYAESRQKFYFALIPVFRQITILAI